MSDTTGDDSSTKDHTPIIHVFYTLKSYDTLLTQTSLNVSLGRHCKTKKLANIIRQFQV